MANSKIQDKRRENIYVLNSTILNILGPGHVCGEY